MAAILQSPGHQSAVVDSFAREKVSAKQSFASEVVSVPYNLSSC